jgi:cephalosporin-C deacetylase
MHAPFRLLLALLAPLCAQAQIHSAATGLSPEWATSAWGGLKTSQLPADSGRVLKIEATPAAIAWSGVLIGPAWNQPPTAALPVSAADLATGALLLEINGEGSGGQTLQFAVTLADATGAELKGTGTYLSFDKVSDADRVDADPATWQKIRIPLARAAGTQAASATGIKKIGLQFTGTAPTGGVLLRNIRLESSGEAPAAPAAATAQPAKLKLTVTATQPEWLYRVNEPVVFRLAFTAEQPVTDTIEVRYRVGPEKFEGPSKTIAVPPGGVEVPGGTLDRPGFLRLSATAFAGGKELKGMATAAVSADQIRPTQTEPADFDAFWKSTKAELAKIPHDPVLVPKPELSGPTFDAYELSLANFDPNGEKPRFYGVLCVPKGPGPFPALLQTPGAGVRGYKGEVWVPRDQFITLEVGIHGIPVTEPGKFYNEQAAGPLKDYQTRNLADREKFYYRRVYAGVMRSLDYLTTHPKWDKKNLVIRGGSQGGQLAIVGAALEPRVTAVAAAFPAFSDVTGYTVGRAGGWPGLFTGKAPEEPEAKARRAAQVATTGYYDTVNFAKRLKVPAYFAWGYNDEVCPPTSFYAMLSVVTAPKEVRVWKEAGHNLPGDGWGAYSAWAIAKAKGK